jgi:hypothetical protein
LGDGAAPNAGNAALKATAAVSRASLRKGGEVSRRTRLD